MERAEDPQRRAHETSSAREEALDPLNSAATQRRRWEALRAGQSEGLAAERLQERLCEQAWEDLDSSGYRSRRRCARCSKSVRFLPSLHGLSEAERDQSPVAARRADLLESLARDLPSWLANSNQAKECLFALDFPDAPSPLPKPGLQINLIFSAELVQTMRVLPLAWSESELVIGCEAPLSEEGIIGLLDLMPRAYPEPQKVSQRYIPVDQLRAAIDAWFPLEISGFLSGPVAGEPGAPP